LVVVTPTHRLGAFGYAYLHRLLGTKDATANVGMLDIVASLVWVQENIRQFGGDPDNVTVMGESGGGMKVTTLLAMPRARGLFHRAVCIGGALAGGFLSSVSTIDQAAMLTERLVQAIGCRADELADLPMQILIDGQERSDARPVVWRPVIDGDILPGYPNEVIASGGGAPVPLLIGTAAHEADFLVQASPIFNVTEPAGLEPLVGERIHRIAAEYRAEDDGADDLEIARRILTDYFLRMPSIKIAESNAAHGNPTWMYLFDWTQPHEPYIRSTHGNETVFIFGNLQATGTGRGFESASGLSRLMQDAWIAFIRGGDPNHPNLPEWTRYSAKQRKTLRFADPLVILDDPRGRGRVAWD
jgi:para-nitrobenzyl esterase